MSTTGFEWSCTEACCVVPEADISATAMLTTPPPETCWLSPPSPPYELTPGGVATLIGVVDATWNRTRRPPFGILAARHATSAAADCVPIGSDGVYVHDDATSF